MAEFRAKETSLPSFLLQAYKIISLSFLPPQLQLEKQELHITVVEVSYH